MYKDNNIQIKVQRDQTLRVISFLDNLQCGLATHKLDQRHTGIFSAVYVSFCLLLFVVALVFRISLTSSIDEEGNIKFVDWIVYGYYSFNLLYTFKCFLALIQQFTI